VSQERYSQFFIGEKAALLEAIRKYMIDPAGNYNAEIGDLLPYGLVEVTNVSLLIFDPRHEWPGLYTSASNAIVPVAFNGKTGATAHYDAVKPAKSPRVCLNM
jgi:hypothetical protein